MPPQNQRRDQELNALGTMEGVGMKTEDWLSLCKQQLEPQSPILHFVRPSNYSLPPLQETGGGGFIL